MLFVKKKKRKKEKWEHNSGKDGAKWESKEKKLISPIDGNQFTNVKTMKTILKSQND